MSHLDMTYIGYKIQKKLKSSFFVVNLHFSDIRKGTDILSKHKI